MIDIFFMLVFFILIGTAVFQFVNFAMHDFTGETDWRYHQTATKDNVEIYGRGSFEDFKREFNKREWVMDDWKDSLFTPDHSYVKNTGSIIHAGIIAFDAKGMVLDYSDYAKAMKYVKKYIKQKGLNMNKGKESKNLWN